MRWLITGGCGFIGTNMALHLIDRKDEVLCFDVCRPKISELANVWQKGDITDPASITKCVKEFAPDRIIHLAAIATFEANVNDLRRVNIEGTKNVLSAARQVQCERIVLASTQYVNGPGLPFSDDSKYRPINAYGESKADMERAIGAVEFNELDWIVIRPTNIWGPYHPRFPHELWKVIKGGYYFHPKGAAVMRSYGYVSNVVEQIRLLCIADAGTVRHKVFYVGDAPIDSGTFLDELSLAIRGTRVRRIPIAALWVIAHIGDLVRSAGIRPVLDSDRLRRMSTEHLARDELIWREFGYTPVPLKQACAATAEWLKTEFPDIYS